jgi:hypothetical protein
VTGYKSGGSLIVPQDGSAQSNVLCIVSGGKDLRIVPTLTQGSASIQYRTSSTIFSRSDSSITWNDYTDPITLSDGHFIQIKLSNSEATDAIVSMQRIDWSDDTTPPTVTIITSDPQNVSTDNVQVAWTDSDDVGVVSRKWRLGSAPDATHGTEATSPATVTGLSSGANTVYIGAGDTAGNWGSDSITVNYTPQAVGISSSLEGSATLQGGATLQ